MEREAVQWRPSKTDSAIALVAFFAVATTYIAIRQANYIPFRTLSGTDIGVLIAMFLLVILMDLIPTTVSRWKFNTGFTVSGTVFVAATIGYGAIVGVLLAGVGTLLTELFARREPRKLVFNVAQFICATGAAGIAYHLIAGNGTRAPLATTETVIAALFASLLYLALNNSLFSFVVGVAVGKSPLAIFIANTPGLLMQNITLPSIGLLLTTVRDLSPISLFIALLPLMGPYIAMRGYRDTQVQIRQTIEALADTIDRRDPATARHSERVAGYVQQIVDELGNIKFTDGEAMVLGARVHDLGKIAIPDAVLMKPTLLTDNERALVIAHPVTGYDILNNLTIYKEGLSVVRSHHERYDGTGYPDGLSGEDIPLGARILAVADAYDVMTSDRPYARARTMREAREELIRSKGTHFDPVIVDAFIAVLDRAPHTAMTGMLTSAPLATRK